MRPSAPRAAGPSPMDPLEGGRAAGQGTDSPAWCNPCPGSCGTMLAGRRQGAGEPSSPSPVGRAQGRGRSLASPAVPTPLDLRLQWPPLGGKWGSAGGRPSGSQGLPVSTCGAWSSRLGPGDSRARATFWAYLHLPEARVPTGPGFRALGLRGRGGGCSCPEAPCPPSPQASVTRLQARQQWGEAGPRGRRP